MTKINKQSAVKFIKSIVCLFGVPNRIITGPSLPAIPSRNNVKNWASRFAMHLLLTQKTMDKSKEPTQKSLRVSRPSPLMAWKNMARSGLMSFRAHYGVTGHHLVGKPERLLSYWCTGPRSSSPRRSPWAPSVSRHMMKSHRTSSGVKISTSSMSEDGNL
jgi:hypothetical protein